MNLFDLVESRWFQRSHLLLAARCCHVPQLGFATCFYRYLVPSPTEGTNRTRGMTPPRRGSSCCTAAMTGRNGHERRRQRKSTAWTAGSRGCTESDEGL